MAENRSGLSERVAIITGATSFIGKTIAQKLAGLGAMVIINGRNIKDGERTVEGIKAGGGKACFEQADIFIPGQVQDMADRVFKRFGRIDILVASGAGASADSPPFKFFKDMDIEDYDKYIRSHWLTRIFAIRSVLPYMIKAKYGKIVTIGTDAGRVATVGESIIGGATAGMMQMSRCLARELGRDGIRINCVAMSYISDAHPRWGDELFKTEYGKNIINGLLKRMLFDVKKKDIAEITAFLSGPESDAITGQTISVNGGLSTLG